MRRWMPLLRSALLLAAFIDATAPNRATAGLAEWEIKTPGGYRISHSDPYIAEHGTCLRSPEATGSANSSDRILADQLAWWTYYPGHVSGQSRNGYFLLDEKTGLMREFATEPELQRAIESAHLGPATSKRLTGSDGWNLAWGPFMRERCRLLKEGEGPYASMSQADRERARAMICDQLHAQDPAAPR